jgi:hypothetical protein
MFEIAARIEDEDNAVGCFDPTKVILRLIDEIPEAIVCVHDYGWKDYDHFQQRSAYEGTIRVAENDARRRAPIYIFRLRTATKQVIRGHAERYIVSIRSDEEISNDLKQRFILFLNSLTTNQIEIKSVRIENNDEFLV